MIVRIIIIVLSCTVALLSLVFLIARNKDTILSFFTKKKPSRAYLSDDTTLPSPSRPGEEDTEDQRFEFWTPALALKHLSQIPYMVLKDKNNTYVSLVWTQPSPNVLRTEMTPAYTFFMAHPLARSYMLNECIAHGIDVKLVDFMSIYPGENETLFADITIAPNTIRAYPKGATFLSMQGLDFITTQNFKTISTQSGVFLPLEWTTLDSDPDPSVDLQMTNDVKFRVISSVDPYAQLTIGRLRSDLRSAGMTDKAFHDRLSMVRTSTNIGTPMDPKMELKVYILFDTLNKPAVYMPRETEDGIPDDTVMEDDTIYDERHAKEEAEDQMIVDTMSFRQDVYDMSAAIEYHRPRAFTIQEGYIPSYSNWTVDIQSKLTPSRTWGGVPLKELFITLLPSAYPSATELIYFVLRLQQGMRYWSDSNNPTADDEVKITFANRLPYDVPFIFSEKGIPLSSSEERERRDYPSRPHRPLERSIIAKSMQQFMISRRAYSGMYEQQPSTDIV